MNDNRKAVDFDDIYAGQFLTSADVIGVSLKGDCLSKIEQETSSHCH